MIEYRSFSICPCVTIDNRLSRTKHVQTVYTSFGSKVKMLRCINFLPKATQETIYYRKVIPCVLHGMVYGMTVWGSCSDHLLKDLEIIHLKAARLIHKLPRDMDDEAALTVANWMPLKYFYCFRILTIAHKDVDNLDLADVNSLIVKKPHLL